MNTTKDIRHRSCKQAAEHRTPCLQANGSDRLGYYLATRELNWSVRVHIICRQDENRREKCSIFARPTFCVSRECSLGTRLWKVWPARLTTLLVLWREYMHDARSRGRVDRMARFQDGGSNQCTSVFTVISSPGNKYLHLKVHRAAYRTCPSL